MTADLKINRAVQVSQINKSNFHIHNHTRMLFSKKLQLLKLLKKHNHKNERRENDNSQSDCPDDSQ